METNIPGVYVVGDICTYDGKVNLIATGLGEAPVAVNSAKFHKDPNAKKYVPHSSDMFKANKLYCINIRWNWS